MYAAKQGGRNRYSYFTPDLQLAAQARQQVTLDLRSALALEQFELHYQPIVNLQSGRIERAEALLRWRHPQRGLLAPAEFLPFAEAGGLMLEIGDWVFRQAAQQARRWQDSWRRLPGQHQPVAGAAARRCRAVRGWLQLRPAGTAAAQHRAGNYRGRAAGRRAARQRAPARLREMGLQVALDNFGTGYSSLSHLKHFGIDLLKLDHSFIQHLATTAATWPCARR
jgi:EAL domain-containing protein (putative c-di-GMP-specific phosphodiesterase class I)